MEPDSRTGQGRGCVSYVLTQPCDSYIMILTL